MVDAAFGIGSLIGSLYSFFTNMYNRNRMFHHSQRTLRCMVVGGFALSYFNFVYRYHLERHMYEVSYLHMMMQYGREIKEYGKVQEENQEKIKRFIAYTQIDVE